MASRRAMSLAAVVFALLNLGVLILLLFFNRSSDSILHLPGMESMAGKASMNHKLGSVSEASAESTESSVNATDDQLDLAQVYWADYTILAVLGTLAVIFEICLEGFTEGVVDVDVELAEECHEPREVDHAEKLHVSRLWTPLAITFRGEITVLGFISFTTYLWDSAGLYETLAAACEQLEYGLQSEEEWRDAVEQVHYSLFLSMLLHILIAVCFSFGVQRNMRRISHFMNSPTPIEKAFMLADHEKLVQIREYLTKFLRDMDYQEDIDVMKYLLTKFKYSSYFNVSFSVYSWAWIILIALLTSCVAYNVDEYTIRNLDTSSYLLLMFLSFLCMFGSWRTYSKGWVTTDTYARDLSNQKNENIMVRFLQASQFYISFTVIYPLVQPNAPVYPMDYVILPIYIAAYAFVIPHYMLYMFALPPFFDRKNLAILRYASGHTLTQYDVYYIEKASRIVRGFNDPEVLQGSVDPHARLMPQTQEEEEEEEALNSSHKSTGTTHSLNSTFQADGDYHKV